MRRRYWVLCSVIVWNLQITTAYAYAVSEAFVRRYNMICNIIVIIASIGCVIYFATRNHTSVFHNRPGVKHEQYDVIQKLIKIDTFWDITLLELFISKAYYLIEYAWSNKDIHTFQPYISKSLYDKWVKEIEKMRVNKQINVRENVQLLSTNIVCIHDFYDRQQTYFWVRIKGRMANYDLWEDTGRISGSKGTHSFCEYWKFQRTKTGACLDEICQENEFQERQLTTQSQRIIHVVCGVMKSEQGYLIGRRGSGLHENIWEFPGGKVEPKETYEQAIKREFQEELDININVLHELKVYDDVREQEVLQIHAYACEYVDGTINLHAHHEIQFVSAKQLQNYTFEDADQGLLKYIKKHRF